MMITMEYVLSSLKERGCNPRQQGEEWSACCPAHDDRNPSLSIREGSDGKVLIHCHAGCEYVAIYSSLGLDSFNYSSSRLPQSPGKDQSESEVDFYATAKEAAHFLEERHGKWSGYWTYHNELNKPVGVILRWDDSHGKIIRPVSLHENRWKISGMSIPRPLYCLPDISDADRVFITEGEKAADAVRKLGLTVTTSSHGSNSAHQTDWAPLAGKQCVILPDNDEAGAKYAEKVETQLAALGPPPEVKILELPDLPESGDMADWIEDNQESSLDELRQRVESLVNQLETVDLGQSSSPFMKYQEFPTEILPEPIREFVEVGARAIVCSPSYLALPLLSALAAAIGGTRQLRLKGDWKVPAIIWTATVGDSGTSKTPAFTTVMKYAHEGQRQSLADHAEAMKEFNVERTRYEKQLSAWKRNKIDNAPPTEPDRPKETRYVVSDTTVEALSPLLKDNPRGLLLACDELSGWFGSFDRYASGKGGSDEAHWLPMHSGNPILVDRKTGDQPTLYVPHALVSIAGGIQPEVLQRALGSKHRESGLAARFVFAYPPKTDSIWNESEISSDLDAQMSHLFTCLYGMNTGVDQNGATCPLVLDLTPDAKSLWIEYYNVHGKEQKNQTGELAAAWAKLREYPARFALVIHCERVAAGDTSVGMPDQVDVKSMEIGIELAKWFKLEASRVYSMLSSSKEEQGTQRLLEWIQGKGGVVTAREVQQGHRKYKTAQKARLALNELVQSGYGHWENSPSGNRGQPTERFVLSTVITISK